MLFYCLYDDRKYAECVHERGRKSSDDIQCEKQRMIMICHDPFVRTQGVSGCRLCSAPYDESMIHILYVLLWLMVFLFVSDYDRKQ